MEIKQFKRAGGVALVTLFLAACGTKPTANSTVQVQRANLKVTVSGSGSVAPLQASDLTFGVNGKIQKVLVKEGQTVKEGDILGELDSRDLDQQVLQAEAALETAQAKLQQAVSGNATDQDKTVAKANVDEAKSQVEKAQTGDVTAQDIAAAQADVQTAQGNLERARAGNSTPADIAAARAAVVTAQGNLQRVRTSVTAADIAAATAVVRIAEANLQRIKTGNVTQADLDNAQAAVRSAESKLQVAQQGPTSEQLSAVQVKMVQAQVNLQKVSAADSAAKTTAEQNVRQAVDNVLLAQGAYSNAYWNVQNSQGGIDPLTGKKFTDETIISKIVDPSGRIQLYVAAFGKAKAALDEAQSKLQQAQVAAVNAHQQEAIDVAGAQAQVADAQNQLNLLLKGPKASDVVAAQALVDQARAQFQKLRQGGTAADVAAAQGQVDQARAQLSKLQNGPNPGDLAAAEGQIQQAQAQLQKAMQGPSQGEVDAAAGQVNQAQAQLDKLQAGGTPADIAAAQAKLAQAQAGYEKLAAGATPSDRSIAQAGIHVAEAQLAAAKLNRDDAILRAPFAGIVTAVNVVPGDRVAAAGAKSAPFSLVDVSQLHVDLSISEADTTQIKEGQPATVKIDALGSQTITGKVNYLAKAGTTVQSVTTYLARVDLPNDNPLIRVGMNCTVQVGVSEKQNVLLIPTRAIRNVGDKHFVRLLKGATFIDTEIHTGAASDTQTEVTSGLNEGDTIAASGAVPATSKTTLGS